MSDTMKLVTCTQCGETTPGDANFCDRCGGSLTAFGKVRDPRGLVHQVAERTDVGYRHHVNQDAGQAWTARRKDGVPVSLLVVADGVSAGVHSERASRIVVDLIQERLKPLLEDSKYTVGGLLAQLKEVTLEANRRVAEQPHDSLANAAATTLVAALCVGEEGAGVWCGDSRAYRLCGTDAIRLTKDHSWAQGAVDHGIMSAEDAARDPRAHMITRWLGPSTAGDPGIEDFHFALQAGDVVLACTDGLYMYFTPPDSDEREMTTLMLASHDLDAGLERLVSSALERGGADNVTAAALSLVRLALPSVES